MPGDAPLHGLCWSCQTNITDHNCVRLNAEQVIPCCYECWGTMSAADRLQTGLRFLESNNSRPAVRSFQQAVEWLLAEAEKRGADGEDFEWLRRN